MTERRRFALQLIAVFAGWCLSLSLALAAPSAAVPNAPAAAPAQAAPAFSLDPTSALHKKAQGNWIGVTDQILQPWLGAVMGKITVLAAILLFLQWRPAGLFVTRSRSLEG